MKMIRKQKKNQKKKRKYQQELIRKPKLSREFFRSLIVAVIVVFLIDFTFTFQAGGYLVSTCVGGMNEYDTQCINSANDSARDLGITDFNYVDVVDGRIVFDVDDETQMELAKRAFMALNFRAHFPSTLYYEEQGLYGEIDYLYQTFRMECAKRPIPYYFGAVYDGEGEEISNQDKILVIVQSMPDDTGLSSTGRKVYFYNTDMKAIEQAYPGFFEELSEAVWTKEGLYDVKMRDIYVDKSGFYILPKYIDLYYSGDDDIMDDINEAECVKSYELSKCDFTGYSPLDIDGEDVKILGPVYIDDNVVDSKPFESYKQLKADPEFQMNLQKMVDGENYISEYSRGNLRADGYVMTRSGNGNIISVVVIDCDLFRDWLPILIIEYIVTILIGIIISFIVARVRYNKKLLAYEIDSYRRKTTNAMAHDLKSPLMVISGYAENMNKNTAPDKVEYYAKNILDIVGDMDKMIANILELSRMEEGSHELKLEKLDLRGIVKEKLTKYEQKMSDRDLTVNISGEANVNGDREWMDHLIDNLISNAIKYSTDKSVVDIKLSDNMFSICNDMASELSVPVEQLTEQFVKGDKIRSNTEGNGLGLSIVKNAVELQGYIMNITTDNKKFTVLIHF